MWPWSRPEVREKAGKSYAEQATEQILAEANGTFPDARALAVVEIVAGTFERALSLGMVTGPDMFAMALQPHLGSIGRHLARRGEWAALIDVPPEGGVRLLPAGSWDVRGGWNEGDWYYRLDLFGPSGNITRLVPSAAVVHVRVNALADRPWHGRSALAAFPGTAKLAARIEGLLTTETRVPIGRALTVNGRVTPEQSAEAATDMARRRLSVVGTASAGSDGGARLHAYGPNPAESVLALRDTLRGEILAAFGLTEALVAPGGDGTAQREAWRRAGTSFQAYAAAVTREARAKLNPAIAIDLADVATSDVQGRARAFKALRDAEMSVADAAHNAGLEVTE